MFQPTRPTLFALPSRTSLALSTNGPDVQTAITVKALLDLVVRDIGREVGDPQAL